MGEADKTSKFLGAGTEVSYCITKENKLRIVIEVDEDKIAQAVMAKIAALLSGKTDEKPAPKKRGPRKAKPGQPGYDSKNTPPIPFPEKPVAAGAKE